VSWPEHSTTDARGKLVLGGTHAPGGRSGGPPAGAALNSPFALPALAFSMQSGILNPRFSPLFYYFKHGAFRAKTWAGGLKGFIGIR